MLDSSLHGFSKPGVASSERSDEAHFVGDLLRSRAAVQPDVVVKARCGRRLDGIGHIGLIDGPEDVALEVQARVIGDMLRDVKYACAGDARRCWPLLCSAQVL